MFESRILAAKIQYMIWLDQRRVKKAGKMHKKAQKMLDKSNKLTDKIKSSQVEIDMLLEKLKGMSLYDL